MAKRKLPMYKTPKAFFAAAAEGKLPSDLVVTIDNDSVYACITPEIDGDPDETDDAFGFDVGPREFLEAALKHLKIPSDRP